VNTQQKDPSAMFDIAEQLYKQRKYEKASEIYLQLTSDKTFAAYAYYRLADISNRTQDPLTAKDLFYKAFSIKPDIYKGLLLKDHPNYSYVFRGRKKEPLQEKCPLCGKRGEAYWCNTIMEMSSAHVQEYNPVRVWMRCYDCNHLYAEEFPIQTAMISKKNDKELIDSDLVGMPTNPRFFPYYSEILSKLSQFSEGNELLEIGFGGCECMLVAQEMAFSIFGIDISEGGVAQALRYGLKAEVHDFIKFETEKKWDILILGDVIEHVSDPVLAARKLYGLMKDNGVLWISTPNCEGAFSVFAGHDDAMRKEAAHKNYFSRFSLFKLMEMTGFVPVDYRISAHYNGSMEVIVVKDCYSR